MPHLSQGHVGSQSCSFLLFFLMTAYACMTQEHMEPMITCSSQSQSAACACVIQQQGTHTLNQQPDAVSCICMCDTGACGIHTLMQQPDTVSCMCMWDTATQHPYPHATARHSQLHLLGRTAHDLVQLEEVCHVLLSGTALLHPSPAHVTVC